MSSRNFLIFSVFPLVAWLAGCATPTSNLIDLANTQSLVSSGIEANGFRHLVLENGGKTARSKTLHVYLEGDGSPWKYRVLRMRDPTPRRPIMVRLMGLDSQPAVYLGRPCYNGSFADNGCSDKLWTSARYSDEVVSSMASALNAIIAQRSANDVKLFGHSGGGTLALLLADRVPEVTQIVTLAGNLDTDAWIKHHQYSALYGSLNPAKLTPVRASVSQWHFLGGQDSVIPPAIVKPFIRAQKNVFATEISGFTHGCCWQRIWPTVLSALKDNNTGRIPGMRLVAPRK